MEPVAPVITNALCCWPARVELRPTEEELRACFVGSTRFQASHIEKAYQRGYSGLLLTTEVEGGNQLSGTPNHPILTKRGWVPLGLLKTSDYVASCPDTQREPFGYPNENNMPAAAMEKYTALEKAFGRQRVVGSSVDFHGDGEESYVDIVSTNSLLMDTHITKISQRLQEKKFPITNHSSPTTNTIVSESGLSSFGGQTSASFVRGLLHSQLHRLRACADMDIKLLHGFGNGILSNAKNSSQLTTRLPTTVPGGHLFPIKPLSGWNPEFRLVKSIGARQFKGHVYNLQTASGWYLANGIVAHNCRPHLEATLAYARPDWILALGSVALSSLIPGAVISADRGRVLRAHGHWGEAWVVGTFHPAWALRNPGQAYLVREDIAWFRFWSLGVFEPWEGAHHERAS